MAIGNIERYSAEGVAESRLLMFDFLSDLVHAFPISVALSTLGYLIATSCKFYKLRREVVVLYQIAYEFSELLYFVRYLYGEEKVRTASPSATTSKTLSRKHRLGAERLSTRLKSKRKLLIDIIGVATRRRIPDTYYWKIDWFLRNVDPVEYRRIQSLQDHYTRMVACHNTMYFLASEYHNGLLDKYNEHPIIRHLGRFPAIYPFILGSNSVKGNAKWQTHGYGNRID